MIGVLALQGDFREHIQVLKKLSTPAKEIRSIKDMDIDALIIPGGESTTIGKLLETSGLSDEIIRKHNKGMPIYGSCAGAILLARNIKYYNQPTLGLIDITIERNSYGRQINSFVAEIDIQGKPFHAIFIRAPRILKTDAEILAIHNKDPVLINKDKILISTFHPELTDDTRVHQIFLDMI